MYTSPPSLSITCIAMDNVRKILKDRQLTIIGLLTLIHSKHPDCGLPYYSLRRLVSHERKMTIDEAILICDALNVPFTSLFSFAGEVPHGQLKGMTAVDIYHAIEQDDEGTPATRSNAWDIGFGLQAADGLTPSDYAIEQSKEQISGKASHIEVEYRLREYHSRNSGEAGHFEADIVSTRISSILQAESFAFVPPMLMRIHRHLFDGVFTDDWVGRWRQVDLTKKEPVLRGDSVPYAPFLLIGEMLDYEFDQEKRRQAGHPRADRYGIAVSAFDFMSRLWQIHPFREGNTRTVAVFVILYLRRLGFTVDSEPFASHAQYLRDALVLDNILNPAFKDPAPLRRFMERTLFNPSIELENLLKSSSMDSHRFGQSEGSRGDIPV